MLQRRWSLTGREQPARHVWREHARGFRLSALVCLTSLLVLVLMPSCSWAQSADQLRRVLAEATDSQDVAQMASALTSIETLENGSSGLAEALVDAGIVRIALDDTQQARENFVRALCLCQSVQLPHGGVSSQAREHFSWALREHRRTSVELPILRVQADGAGGMSVGAASVKSGDITICPSIPCTIRVCPDCEPELVVASDGYAPLSLRIPEQLSLAAYYPDFVTVTLSPVKPDPVTTDPEPTTAREPLPDISRMSIVEHLTREAADGSTQHEFVFEFADAGGGELWMLADGYRQHLLTNPSGTETVLLGSSNPRAEYETFARFELQYEMDGQTSLLQTADYPMRFERRTRWNRWNVVSASCYTASALLATAGAVRHAAADDAHDAYHASADYNELSGLWDGVDRHREARDQFFVAAGVCLVPAIITSVFDFDLPSAPKPWPFRRRVEVGARPGGGVNMTLDVSELIFSGEGGHHE